MKDDLISRQDAIDALDGKIEITGRTNAEAVKGYVRLVKDRLERLPSAQPEPCEDAVSRKAVYDAMVEKGQRSRRYKLGEIWELNGTEIREALDTVPSAQPEQRYTEEELRVFQHGISLSLLSKRSAQHWQYDENTTTEIKFLERLYEKVGADIRGEEV